MNHHVFEDDRHKFRRISKAHARARWAEGKRDFALCPSNLRPGFPWAPHMLVRGTEETDFDKLVSNFEWYNCSDEAGRYTSFYLVEDKKEFLLGTNQK